MNKFYIGANNTNGKLEKGKACRIMSRHISGFTCYETNGYWQGKKEKCLVIEIDKVSNKITNKIAGELAKELGQNAIGVQNIRTSMKFVS